MDSLSHLWIFFGVVLGVVLLPGLDMTCVLATALGGGRRAGLAAVGGIAAGGAAHVLIGGMGIAAVLAVAPGLFDTLLLAGALYIAWIGATLARSGFAFDPAVAARLASVRLAFRRGALTNLLNPKAYLFMLAVFPQFVRPGQGHLWAQVVVLWLICAATQVAVYGAVALLAARARDGLAARPVVLDRLGRGVGALLVLTAALSALEGWRRLG
jgi:threonine/homoserine/homoserine lactone efflux protein